MAPQDTKTVPEVKNDRMNDESGRALVHFFHDTTSSHARKVENRPKVSSPTVSRRPAHVGKSVSNGASW